MKKRYIIICLVLDILALGCLFLAYGPVDTFRNWFINTAMTSWNHKYFAHILYSDDQISKVFSSIEEEVGGGESVDTKYNSYYDEQILKKDDNDLYKLIELDEKGYKGHILVVYDPARISLEISPNVRGGGQKISSLAESFDAVAAVNASGFSVNANGSLTPSDTFIKDGELYIDGSGDLIGFNKDHKLVLTGKSPQAAIEDGMMDAVSFGPFLIVNGKLTKFSNGGGYGLRPRTAVGQREDGIVLFVVIDGNEYGTVGIDMEDLANIFARYGCINAANLDGGGSSSLYVDGKLVNNPTGWGYSGERYLPNAWIIK